MRNIPLALDFLFLSYHQSIYLNLFLRVGFDWYWVVFEENQWISSPFYGRGETVRYLKCLYANGLLLDI